MKCVFILVPALCGALFSQRPIPVAISIQIEANQWNRTKLLEKLNQQGFKQGMKFVLPANNEKYDYRIVFTTGKTPNAIIINGTGATSEYDTGYAEVYDSLGEELFRLKNEAWWNEDSATNGTAKKIIKRLKEIRSKPRTK